MARPHVADEGDDIPVTENLIHEETACYLLHSDFLIGLFLDPEDGGETFLRNVG
jgi:hypothetical protein